GPDAGSEDNPDRGEHAGRLRLPRRGGRPAGPRGEERARKDAPGERAAQGAPARNYRRRGRNPRRPGRGPAERPRPRAPVPSAPAQEILRAKRTAEARRTRRLFLKKILREPLRSPRLRGEILL